MTITITGRPISKKRHYRRGANGRMYLSKTWKKWEEEALWQLKPYKKTFKGKLDVSYTFYCKGKLNPDGDNLQAGVNDILQKAGIIENDRNIVSWSGVKIADMPDWMTEVEITELK